MKKYLILVSLVSLFACKEEVVKTPFEQLTDSSQKTWSLKEATITLAPDSKLNVFGFRPVCETDNLLILKSNNTYDFVEGETKCNANDPDSIIRGLGWSLSSDSKELIVDKFIFLNYTINDAVFSISEITDSSFSGETEVEYNGSKYTGNVTFEAVK